jgi:hypothetical protein
MQPSEAGLGGTARFKTGQHRIAETEGRVMKQHRQSTVHLFKAEQL